MGLVRLGQSKKVTMEGEPIEGVRAQPLAKLKLHLHLQMTEELPPSQMDELKEQAPQLRRSTRQRMPYPKYADAALIDDVRVYIWGDSKGWDEGGQMQL